MPRAPGSSGNRPGLFSAGSLAGRWLAGTGWLDLVIPTARPPTLTPLLLLLLAWSGSVSLFLPLTPPLFPLPASSLLLDPPLSTKTSHSLPSLVRSSPSFDFFSLSPLRP